MKFNLLCLAVMVSPLIIRSDMAGAESISSFTSAVAEGFAQGAGQAERAGQSGASGNAFAAVGGSAEDFYTQHSWAASAFAMARGGQTGAGRASILSCWTTTTT